MDTGAKAARTEGTAHHFPCPACGADLRFDPATGGLRCGHCGHDEVLGAPSSPWQAAATAPVEQDFAAALATDLPGDAYDETQLVACTSCGAQVELDDTVQGTSCPFCASPVVTATGTHRAIRPQAVLPFAMTEPAAHDAMRRWLGGLWFAPNGLKRYARKGRRMDGIYVPFWTFDADTASRYRGERGTVHHRQQSVVRNGQRTSQTVAEVRWRPVSGAVRRAFDDVLVLASRSLPRRFTEALPPWDLSQLRPYAPEYLAGMRAEAYTVDLRDGVVLARETMDRQIERDVRFDIGGDRQRIAQIETQVANVTFKHVLLPIWIAAYRYGGRSYRIVINGQTGRVEGERPWSVWKIALTVLTALIAAAAFGFLASNQ
ncbi:primosomal protein N' (replication factor Y) - superfamily II helicase [Meridianimarinicoccus sp. RP-17]|uniref:primosomal protein N' (replication factor Y) - superfamily II helicase n=1 Tax=Meridianimarinicoccus zhengii TaxID=2056810 RepID=UPI000DADE50D|nr:primosomal protein N' (replication factor Y) - superfamily II helicase [Phycocomes zhengii]